MLFQRPGQPGLEILREDGSWQPVPVFPPGYHPNEFPPILVNIGDVLSYWTNGLLKSTIHRVVRPRSGGEDRYSIAIFFDPNEDEELVAMPSASVAARKEVFAANGYKVGYGGGANAGGLRTLTAGEFLKSRVAASLE